MVWAENPNPNPRLDNRLKDIADKLDVPPLKAELRKFVDWVSNYTLSPRGMVRAHGAAHGRASGPGARARRRAARRPAAEAHDGGAQPRAGAAAPTAWCAARARSRRRPACRAGVIDGLIDEGTLETLVLPPEPVARAPDPDFAQPDFTPAQRAAADALRATVAAGGYSATLLDGVTGSGKTAGLFRGGRRNASAAAGRR